MVASDGGVFAFGDAHFAGSCASIGGCPAPVVAVVPDATGRGYWLLLSNCDMVAFGDAPNIPDTNCQNLPMPTSWRRRRPPALPVATGTGCSSTNGTVFAEGDAKALGPAPAERPLPGATRPWPWSPPATGAGSGSSTPTGPSRPSETPQNWGAWPGRPCPLRSSPPPAGSGSGSR